MKNKILNKLRSKDGASITFALLLFLVCAVLCSVILAAATAAAGRLSKLPEADQRYYAVASAAKLLRDVFKEEPTVSVVKVTVTEETTTYTSGVPSTPAITSTDTKTYLIKKKESDIRESDIVAANEIDAVTIDTIQKDAAKNISNTTTLSGRKLSVTSSVNNILAVDILEDLDADGNITLKLNNKYNAKGNDPAPGEQYYMQLLFGADKTETTKTKTVNISSKAVSETVYEVKSKTTKTEITTLTWNLTGIKTNS